MKHKRKGYIDRMIIRKVGENMNSQRLAYCNECEDLVEFDIFEERITEKYKGEEIEYQFKVGRCKCCNCEVATDIDYNSRKSEAKIEAYKRKKGIIELSKISEILEKYDIGKEVLADIAGFGKVTIKRYYDGVIPAKEYSDILLRILDDENFYIDLLEQNKDKLKDVAYHKAVLRYRRLKEIGESKIDQIVNYIITNLEEVTPLALEKLLAFSNGVNYALNGKRLIPNECQAWAHGPVYPSIYVKYKKYGYKPIDNGIYSSHGCLRSKLSSDELKAIDLVIKTFGLYSPKILEMISHSQTPWQEKRIGYRLDEKSQAVIDEESTQKYYIENDLCSEEKILNYIWDCIRRNRVLV